MSAAGTPSGTTVSVPRTPFFYGWVIVALAALCSFWGPGVVQRSYTVILKPLTDDLGVPRTVGVLGVTLAALAGDLASPLVGWMVDRRGARFLVAASAVVTGLTLVALSLVQAAWLFLLLFGVVLGLARPSLQAVGAQTSVAKWFVRRRGRAVTFSTLGLPISAVVIIPVTEWMVSTWDWRAAWAVLGCGVLVGLAVPAAVFMRGAPEESGLLPDGDAAPSRTEGAAAPPRPTEADWEARDAFRTRTFWALSLGFAIIGMVPTILSLHMFPYFTDQGIAPATAAAAAAASGSGWWSPASPSGGPFWSGRRSRPPSCCGAPS